MISHVKLEETDGRFLVPNNNYGDIYLSYKQEPDWLKLFCNGVLYCKLHFSTLEIFLGSIRIPTRENSEIHIVPLLFFRQREGYYTGINETIETINWMVKDNKVEIAVEGGSDITLFAKLIHLKKRAD